jgi:hypothetical protein
MLRTDVYTLIVFNVMCRIQKPGSHLVMAVTSRWLIWVSIFMTDLYKLDIKTVWILTVSYPQPWLGDNSCSQSNGSLLVWFIVIYNECTTQLNYKHNSLSAIPIECLCHQCGTWFKVANILVCYDAIYQQLQGIIMVIFSTYI